MPSSHCVFSALTRRFLAAGACCLLLAPAARAFQFAHGELTGSFDSTFSFGALYRLENPDPAYYGTSNSFNGVFGQQTSVNTDDGNLNYGKGWVSQIFKGSHDLELRYRNYGLFARGYYFGDLKSEHTRRTPLSTQARERVTQGEEFLDLYVVAKYTLNNGMPLDLRFGRQVLSLGESTFIPNGNNVVNPVDLSKLRVPGAELKEAFLPVNMLKASIGLTPNLTFEPFWLLEFRRNELEPAGTYFSTNDFASRGGSKVFLGFGTLPDNGTLGGIPRENDRDAGNFNQYGASIRYLAHALNDTEFGLYYANYHSRSPVISARTPTSPISSALVISTATSLATANLVPVMLANGFPPAGIPTALNTLIGAALTNVPIAALPASLQPYYPSAQVIATNAGKVGLLTAAATGRYFNEYPENISMVGASFNTSLGRSGITLQGDVSVKNHVPLQVDDVELLFATLSSLNPVFGANNQIGNYLGQLNREVPGYRRHRVVTTQSTLTKVFGPVLGSQQLSVVAEAGGVWANLPDKSTLRYDGPGTFASGNPTAMANTGFGTVPATPSSAFADSFSWGYQILARLEYNNVFAGVNLAPSIAFSHDVKGNTPLPLGNFIEGRKSINLAAEFTFQNAWALELRYVNYSGAGRYNLLSDRDYVATTLKYSF